MRTLLATSALLVLAATQARAADSMILHGLAQPSTGTLALSGVSGLNDGLYYAGPFTATLNGGSGFRVFCADLLHETAYNVTNAVTIQDTFSMGSGYQQAARIINKYGASAGNDQLLNAALQGAIWKSIFPTVNLADGTTGATALANSYLSEDLSGYSAHASYYNLGNSNQSMLAPVPEPASMAALAVGALGLLKRRKRA